MGRPLGMHLYIGLYNLNIASLRKCALHIGMSSLGIHESATSRYTYIIGTDFEFSFTAGTHALVLLNSHSLPGKG